ncbi:ImmA/IrrE family metallo-endopeptidase [Salinibacterium sp. SWN139]|uniref:ImmA/IrrE family metallo-endopeptidase n=1 Tax=Salinibacterium sp. SWN139 TaxID=2792055 RepID=UPI0018CDEDDA|nr:ImmA/IrrE family metallo-endopeptidase [Salinibacterium sp. SWN139]MBH0054491.1 ImmA/IrrE family metallo-endopeptidase [Salinibacterium sp. SWN139]
MLVKEAAKQAAVRTLEEYWDGSFPIDPVAIAEAHDIEVQFTPLVAGVSGAILAEPGEVVIVIDETENYGRQMFTCAHELGHYIERKDSGDEEFSFVERRTQKYDLHELYADEFAGNLLMPEDEFREQLTASDSVYLAASHFGVSPLAIEKRKERLGF